MGTQLALLGLLYPLLTTLLSASLSCSVMLAISGSSLRVSPVLEYDNQIFDALITEG